MTFIGSAISKDLARRLREPWVIVIWIGIPLMVGGMLTLMMGGDSGTPSAKLLIADQDQSVVSGLVGGFFSQGQLAELITSETVSLEQGKILIDAGEASALLVIPKNFGSAVLAAEHSALVLWVNPSQRILPAIIEEALGILVDGVFYIQQVLGDELNAIVTAAESNNAAGLGASQFSVGDIAEAIAGKVNLLGNYLLPPVIEIETVVEQKDEQGFNLSLLFFPGILLMALLWTTQGLSDDLWAEREMGTLRRHASSPNRLSAFLTGKVIYSLIVMAAIFSLLLVLGFGYHQLDWLKFPAVLGLLLLAGADFYLLFCLIGLYSPSRRAAGLATTILILPLMMLGGSFFPFESMPGWMATIGQWTPNGLVLNQIKSVLLNRGDPGALGLTVIALLAIGAVLFGVGAWKNSAFAKA